MSQGRSGKTIQKMNREERGRNRKESNCNHSHTRSIVIPTPCMYSPQLRSR
jgi:hypothetical protein